MVFENVIQCFINAHCTRGSVTRTVTLPQLRSWLLGSKNLPVYPPSYRVSYNGEYDRSDTHCKKTKWIWMWRREISIQTSGYHNKSERRYLKQRKTLFR